MLLKMDYHHTGMMVFNKKTVVHLYDMYAFKNGLPSYRYDDL